ncbi:MAG: ISAzo13 family transposase, partial [Nitrososphaerota archaeon]|nr:ISAzo13 family transposase [Nitrososphaerota archaeon]
MDSATRHRIETMLPLLNEKRRRLYLATEAKNIGHGGLKAIHNLTGTSMTTIIKGQKELNT